MGRAYDRSGENACECCCWSSLRVVGVDVG